MLVLVPVVLVLAGTGAAFAANGLPFSDIAGHWAEQSIVNLADRGIIQGHDDGTFGPEEPVTRAQVATFLDRLATEAMTPVPANRGCPDCHVGPYTLKHEAVERGGETVHQGLPDDAGVTTCLTCHAPGSGAREGKGNVAPLSLRDIVHPAHMGSKIFTGNYMGNCFTCHNVNGDGEFELLTQAVDTDARGIPDVVPIPGAVRSHGVDQATLDVVTGGLLYDKWWTVLGMDVPPGDNPMWARQTTNTRSGADTWRCKECHGWDYKGSEGAYGSGSHKTGFPGVYNAQSKSIDDLIAAISGEVDSDHDFSAMGEAAVRKAAAFIKDGLENYTPLIDAQKNAVGGDSAKGGTLFAANCAACHGADGTTLNFGDAADPEYVGTIAVDNPWEFLHKVRVGQPGTSMPAAVAGGWSLQDVLDVLSFAQTLPTQ